MVLTKPQIIYCMLGITELQFHDLIDPCTANSITNNLCLELLKECEDYSDALITEIENEHSENVSESFKNCDPKSGWPIND